MATTEDEFITFVIDNFRGRGTGQAAAAEDVEIVREYIPGFLAELAESDVIYIADGDSVPDAAVHWAAARMSYVPGLRAYFGMQQEAPSLEYCEARLRKLSPPQKFSVLEEQGIDRTPACREDYC